IVDGMRDRTLARTQRREDRVDEWCTGQHPGLLGNDRRRGAQRGGHRQLRGDVAAPDILRERRVDQRPHRRQLKDSHKSGVRWLAAALECGGLPPLWGRRGAAMKSALFSPYPAPPKAGASSRTPKAITPPLTVRGDAPASRGDPATPLRAAAPYRRRPPAP